MTDAGAYNVVLTDVNVRNEIHTLLETLTSKLIHNDYIDITELVRLTQISVITTMKSLLEQLEQQIPQFENKSALITIPVTPGNAGFSKSRSVHIRGLKLPHPANAPYLRPVGKSAVLVIYVVTIQLTPKMSHLIVQKWLPTWM